VSIDRFSRRPAARASQCSQILTEAEGWPDPDPEVVEFIRFSYRRRGIGWPELYDEMCAVAARGLYRGMDYEGLSALGVRFSLGELPRLAGLAQRVVAEERAGRVTTERLRLARDAEAATGSAASHRGMTLVPQPG